MAYATGDDLNPPICGHGYTAPIVDFLSFRYALYLISVVFKSRLTAGVNTCNRYFK